MPKYKRLANSAQVVKDYKGFFQTVSKNDEIETYQILTGEEWEKLSDEPYYAIGKTIDSITSPDTVENLLEYPYIEVTALATGITVKANSEDNPHSLGLTINIPFVIENLEKNVESLIFEGAGEVKVTGFFK